MTPVNSFIKYLRFPAIFLLCLAINACKPSAEHEQTINDLMGELKKTVDGVKQSLGEKKEEVSKQTSEEMEKLFVFEYNVVELDKKSSREELQAKLTALGRERWECFDVVPQEKTIQFFCKRHPKTYLRYVPRVF